MFYNIKQKPYNTTITDLPGVGLYRFRMEQLQGINLIDGKDHSDYLAGHIHSQKEITDENSLRIIDSLVTPVIAEYDAKYGNAHMKTQRMFKTRLEPPELSTVWVNHQKKYEFNPLHDHSGVYSFVIWYDIPYTAEEEAAASPYTFNSEFNASGAFKILYEGNRYPLCNSKDWNGTMAFFPADTLHCVYPFYSTDKERITIAGNYGYK
jgi:hypothetical protein